MGITDGSISPMKDPRGYLTDEEIDKLFKACTNIKDYLVLRTLSRTGIRVTELTLIKPADLLPNENQIIITQLKKRGESYRNVYVDKVTMDTLVTYIKLKRIEPDQRIFNISRFAIFAIVRKVGKLANINAVGKSKIHPHNFRHCLHKDTLIPTDKGFMTASELYNTTDTPKLLLADNMTATVTNKSTHTSSLLEINVGGSILKCSPAHRLFTVTNTGITEIYARDIKRDTYLLLSKGTFNDDNTGTIGNKLSMAIGYIIGDGCVCFHGDKRAVTTICDKNEKILQVYQQILNDECKHITYHGRSPNFRIYKNKQNKSYNLINNSYYVGKFISNITGLKKSRDKHIPHQILTGTNAEIIGFLSGFYDAEGYNGRYTSSSIRLLKEVQMLLLKLGMISNITTVHRHVKLPQENIISQTQHTLNIPDKCSFNEMLCGYKRLTTYKDSIGRPETYPLQSIITAFSDKHITNKDRWHGTIHTYLKPYGIKDISRYKRMGCTLHIANIFIGLFEHFNEDATPIKDIINSGYRYDKVRSIIEHPTDETVYDFTTNKEMLITDGILSHNSFAIKAIRSGVDIRKLQLLLGHSSYSTTAAYLQYGSKELRDEYDKMFS